MRSKVGTKNDRQVEQLLRLLEDESRQRNSSADLALCMLLSLAKEKGWLPELGCNFHKAFRVIDPTPYWQLDSAIWHLLDGSTLFWQLWYLVTGNCQHLHCRKHAVGMVAYLPTPSYYCAQHLREAQKRGAGCRIITLPERKKS